LISLEGEFENAQKNHGHLGVYDSVNHGRRHIYVHSGVGGGDLLYDYGFFPCNLAGS